MFSDASSIDPFKVNAAISPGVQNYWGERAAKHKLQMVDSCGISCVDISYSKILLGELSFLHVLYFCRFNSGRGNWIFVMPRQAEEVLQYEDFLGWTVSSLKDFLSLRGLKQTGRKPELVARAFGRCRKCN